MFYKLRLKLTVINASIILMLFLLLIGGAYWLSQFDMNKREDHMARKIMADIQSGRIKDIPLQRGDLSDFPPGSPPEPPPRSLLGPPPGPPFGQNLFFVKTSSSGAITFQSSGQPLTAEHLAVLTEEVLQDAHMQGTVLFEQIQYSYLKSPRNDQLGMLVLFRDLSQERNMQRILMTALLIVGVVCSLLSFGASFFMANGAMIPIQKAWQQQKDFLSDVSHELRTPLAIIQTNLDIVKMQSNETVLSQSKWLDNIQDECVYMAKLVDSLLFLARVDSEQQPMDKRPVSFSTLINHAVAHFQAVAGTKGLSLEVLVSAFVNGYGDEVQIKQVIGILLDNAIRHTPTGGKILVSLTQLETKALVTVADSGEGMEPEYLEKIFERFYQIDKSRSKGGAGLGLAIAKCIVERHGGEISVVSTLGAGTTFKVWFPLEKQ